MPAPGPSAAVDGDRTRPGGEPPAPGQRLIDRVLELARSQLGLEVAYLTEMGSDGQVVRLVAGDSAAMGFGAGTETPTEATFCTRMLEGRLPSAVPDTTADPVAQEVGLARHGQVGAYVGVPVRRQGGQLYGTLCCASSDPQLGIGPDAERLLGLLSQLIAEEIEHDERLSSEAGDLRGRMAAILRTGPDIVLQPIVDLRSGRTLGAEALSRFPHAPPELVFADAVRAGVELDLEVAAVRAALDVRASLPRDTYLAVNVSPASIVSGAVTGLVAAETDPAGLVLEVTEHAAVDDYDALHAALADIRARGLQVAIDDAGAGFASFRHIVRLEPDIIKLDRSLTSGVGERRTHDAVVASYVAFARDLGMRLVAEGVEDRRAVRALRTLGVDAAQGYYFQRPQRPPLAPTTFDVG